MVLAPMMAKLSIRAAAASQPFRPLTPIAFELLGRQEMSAGPYGSAAAR